MGLLDELSDKDLRDLAALVGPYLKESSIQVENVPSAETLDGIRSLPGVQFLNGVKRTVAVPVSSLKGRDGDKGQSLDFIILGSYNTLDDLKAAHPNGADTHGLFKVGDALYIWAGAKYEPLNLDVFKTFSLEQFVDVGFTGNDITVDFSRAPYAKVTLSGNAIIYNVSIKNTRDGSSGKILVFQTGFKQISLADNIRGTVDLPLNGDTIALLSYHRIGDVIYMHSNTVLGDIQYPTPQKVVDFQVIYSDANSCNVQWTAPWANNIYDKVTEYDIRYANSLVDANDATVWGGLKKVDTPPSPLSPGELQAMNISGLTPNKEYYIYLKSVKANYGIKYTSEASEPVYFKTLGSEDTTKAYRIGLTKMNVVAQQSTETEGLIDEQENNVYKDDGYIDERFKNYQTFFRGGLYSRSGIPYDIYIDLFSQYNLDKLYLYTTKIELSVYIMKDIGYNWEKAGDITITWSTYGIVNFGGLQARFIKLSFDKMHVGNQSYPSEPDGYEGKLLFAEFNQTIQPIYNIVLYGRPISQKPEGIYEPLRNSTVKRTVDQFFCTNGQLYHQGRIQSMCSGSNVRLFINHEWFVPSDNGKAVWENIATSNFDVDKCGWVSGNNGTGQELEEHFRDTYARFGLKPYMTFKGSKMSPCIYDNSFAYWKPIDSYWLPNAPWKPLPIKGVGGLDKYFSHTYDPNEYKTLSRLVYALSAKYGSNSNISNTSMIRNDSGSGFGLNLISGIEWGNEPDGDWDGFHQYHRPEENAAIASACTDGNGGSMTDEEGNSFFGVKTADPNLLAIHPGYAGIKIGIWESEMLRWNAIRPKGGIPVDVINVHQYFANTGNQHSGSTDEVQYAVPGDYEFEVNGNTERGFQAIVEFRNRFAPNKEIWLTECGFGEAGGRNTKSALQCFSVAGRYIGNWLIPDRHRSDVKGAYTVRTALYLMHLGFSQINYYGTECENDYFDAGQYGTGPGTEMWHWDDCTDNTPGAKYAAIQRYEHTFARGGFASMGMFGNILANGGYPISRGYWYVATMRYRLKDYIYAGRKYLDDSKIMIFCFKKVNEDKGAYVVWYNDRINTGVANVEIPLPAGISKVTHVTNYVPDIANPETVPSGLGNDESRTGLPAARHERYQGGRWVVKTKGAYALGVANYPANPKEGDEVVVLPTSAENPYFPIVGPVKATFSSNGNKLQAQQHEYYNSNTGKYEVGYAIYNAWKQVEACCDYIDYTEEGRHGVRGDEEILDIIRATLITNVSEFPEYYFFDAAPEPDFRSEVKNFTSRTINSSTIELWWNNTNTDDTGYQIFVSDLPETGYTLLKTINAGLENKATISGIVPNSTKYYRIRPVKGDRLGTMSDYTSAKTFSEIPAPDNVRLYTRTATSISFEWDYPSGISDFHHYTIYRGDESDTYSLLTTINDISIKAYTDSNLKTGSAYKYKLRAVGLNGESVYSNVLDTRTLLPEECSPVVTYAVTNKIGTRITMTLDLPVEEIPVAAVADFLLTEEGNERLITAVSRDSSNHRLVHFSIPENSLQDYSKKTNIRLSYTGTSIVSEYGVTMDTFVNVIIGNTIGNYANIEATYQINFGHPEVEVADELWNNILNPNEKNVGYGFQFQLRDTYGRLSSACIQSVKDGNNVKFNGARKDFGVIGLPIAPDEITNTTWDILNGSSDNSNVSRLRLTGLNDERRYTVRLFSATTRSQDNTIQIRVGDMYSNILNLFKNESTFAVVEDCRPAGGVMDVDVFSATIDKSSMINFMLVEEYKSNEEPEGNDVYIRDLTIPEAELGVVKRADIHFNLNVIGKVTHARIADTEEGVSQASWVAIGEDLSLPYTITGDFGNKTYYIQAKNQYMESNVKSISLEYRDPYEPLELTNIYVNNDDAETTEPNVQVFFQLNGTPSHYRISENSAFTGADYLAWGEDGATKPFVLSDSTALKTVYGQVKGIDNAGTVVESAVKADTIQYNKYEPVVLNSLVINSGISETSSAEVTIALSTSGTNIPTHYRLSESISMAGVEWVAYDASQPITFTLSAGSGRKTVYGQVKDANSESSIVSGSINLVAFTKKLLLSFGWHPKNSDDGVSYKYIKFDDLLGVNRPTIGIGANTPQAIYWNDKTDAGTLTVFATYAVAINHNLVENGNQGSVTGNNSGDYPDEYLKRCSYNATYWGDGQWISKLTIPAGTYRFRLFASTIATNKNSEGKQARYELVTAGYGTENETIHEFSQPTGYDFRNNTATWLEQEVTITGNVHIRIVGLATCNNAIQPINILEVIPV